MSSVVTVPVDDFSESYCMIGNFKKCEEIVLKAISRSRKITKSVLITGDAGTGKSEFIEQMKSRHRVEPTDTYESVWGISIKPTSRSVEDLYDLLLNELGDPKGGRGRANKKRKRVLELVDKLGVKVIFVDEVHDVLPKKQLTDRDKFYIAFKGLMDDTECSWVLVGTPRAKILVEIDDQMRERIPYRGTLEQFKFTTPAKIGEFIQFLFSLMPKLDRKKPIFKCLNDSLNAEGRFILSENMSDYDDLLRLLLATNGKVRDLKHLLTTFLEETSDRQSLSVENLKSVVEEAFTGQYDGKNPFQISINKVKAELKRKKLYV
jgi:hypothetical protein